MTWEELSAISTFLTLVVISATAVAAVGQLRHMRSSNAITGYLGLMDRWASPHAREIQNYVFGGELERRLQDRAYRDELRLGMADRIKHPEVEYLDFWESLGMFLKMGFFPEEGVMESGGPVALAAWPKLAPVVAIIRRTRGATAYDNFEYLVSRARMWEASHPEGYFPNRTPHLAVVDEFADDVQEKA
ncbi:MAG: hypothetical protein M3Z37_04335 [Candidatus Eremiobacteraeota bacterium]|nr:hypothetical protein [Candidatus Eremiobacteraeota bacterium]